MQVHARVGSSQHPQVADPTDRKCFGDEIAAHFSFWEEVSWLLHCSTTDLFVDFAS